MLHSNTSYILLFAQTGLTMKFLESDEQGNQMFTFEHSTDYQAVQQQFFEAVETMNPDYIVVSQGLYYWTVRFKSKRFSLATLFI